MAILRIITRIFLIAILPLFLLIFGAMVLLQGQLTLPTLTGDRVIYQGIPSALVGLSIICFGSYWHVAMIEYTIRRPNPYIHDTSLLLWATSLLVVAAVVSIFAQV